MFFIYVNLRRNVIKSSATKPQTEYIVPVYSAFSGIVYPAYDLIVANSLSAYSIFGFRHVNISLDRRICYGSYKFNPWPQKLIALKEINHTNGWNTGGVTNLSPIEYHDICRQFINTTLEILNSV